MTTRVLFAFAFAFAISGCSSLLDGDAEPEEPEIHKTLNDVIKQSERFFIMSVLMIDHSPRKIGKCEKLGDNITWDCKLHFKAIKTDLNLKFARDAHGTLFLRF